MPDFADGGAGGSGGVGGDFDKGGFDGFDDVEDGDATRRAGEEIAAGFAPFAGDEAGSFHFVEDLHEEAGGNFLAPGNIFQFHYGVFIVMSGQADCGPAGIVQLLRYPHATYQTI